MSYTVKTTDGKEIRVKDDAFPSRENGQCDERLVKNECSSKEWKAGLDYNFAGTAQELKAGIDRTRAAWAKRELEIKAEDERIAREVAVLSDGELKSRINEYYAADMDPPDVLKREWSKRNPSQLKSPTPEQMAYSEARERVERGELSEEDFEDGVWN